MPVDDGGPHTSRYGRGKVARAPKPLRCNPSPHPSPHPRVVSPSLKRQRTCNTPGRQSGQERRHKRPSSQPSQITARTIAGGPARGGKGTRCGARQSRACGGVRQPKTETGLQGDALRTARRLARLQRNVRVGAGRDGGACVGVREALPAGTLGVWVASAEPWRAWEAGLNRCLVVSSVRGGKTLRSGITSSPQRRGQAQLRGGEGPAGPRPSRVVGMGAEWRGWGVGGC